jgi:histidinol-phosphatase
MKTAPPRLSEREVRTMLPRIFAGLAAADTIILKHLSHARISLKEDGSEVTVADRGAERVLRRHLSAARPDAAVLGEEYGGTLPTTGACWLIDPIDGTASYVLGSPMFGTLLSLVVDGEPVFGCIHLSALRETTYAARGGGCWLRRAGDRPRRVHVGAACGLGEARVGLTSFKKSDIGYLRGRWRLAAVTRAVGRMRLVGDCVQYALLCRGVLDAAIDPLMNPWDIGALVPCVLEAGGSCSDLAGGTDDLLHQNSFVAASSATLRRALCARARGPARRGRR